MKPRLSPDETKDRIIRVAGEVFGEHGFDGTTIREITDKAGVNVAAVNYHFRDKSELYLRVLREAKGWMQDVTAFETSGTPEEQLSALIYSFVSHLLDPQRPAWHVQIITHEMMHPTPALDVLIREMTEPIFRHLRDRAEAVVRRPVSMTQLNLITSSIVGQCLFYVRSRPMIERLAPELGEGPGQIDLIAEHITSFSLASLHQLYPSKLKPATRVAHPVL